MTTYGGNRTRVLSVANDTFATSFIRINGLQPVRIAMASPARTKLILVNNDLDDRAFVAPNSAMSGRFPLYEQTLVTGTGQPFVLELDVTCEVWCNSDAGKNPSICVLEIFGNPQ